MNARQQQAEFAQQEEIFRQIQLRNAQLRADAELAQKLQQQQQQEQHPREAQEKSPKANALASHAIALQQAREAHFKQLQQQPPALPGQPVAAQEGPAQACLGNVWEFRSAKQLKSGHLGLIEPPIGSHLKHHGFELVRLTRVDEFQQNCRVEFLEPQCISGQPLLQNATVHL